MLCCSCHIKRHLVVVYNISLLPKHMYIVVDSYSRHFPKSVLFAPTWDLLLVYLAIFLSAVSLIVPPPGFEPATFDVVL